jgi:hypothetical protein
MKPTIARAPIGPSGKTIPPAGPITRNHEHRREVRVQNWVTISRNLVNRGRFDLYIDTGMLMTPSRQGARGRAYEQAWVDLACFYMALYQMPLRQAEGFLTAVVTLTALANGLPVPELPTYSTICRRRKDIQFNFPNLPPNSRVCLMVDATGMTLTAPGPWTGEKYGDTRKAKFVKLHAGVDTVTGLFVSMVVTESTGEGSGDPSVGPLLVDQAGEALGGPLLDVLGDGAYDTKAMYEAAGRNGCRMLAPPGSNARVGLHPERDRNIKHLDRTSDKRWREGTGYSDRSLVEGAFSQLKRVTGGRVNARSFEGAQAEIICRVNALNTLMERELGMM